MDTTTSSSAGHIVSINRRKLDRGLVAAGIVVAIAFVIAGSLLAWGHAFAQDQVHNQLAREKVFFPAKGSAALDPKEFPGLQRYAGKQVLTGPEAKAYADQFIWAHMMKASGGLTYSEVSTKAMANPNDASLASLKTTLFQGDMLRASLLSAYGFSRFGAIAYWSMIAAFAGAAAMSLLVILGLFHLRKTRETPVAARLTEVARPRAA